jgi:drug/metabolite transporter (DMT)-like permease
MNIFDFHKTLLQSSADTLKKLSVFNPLTIHKKGTRAKALFALALVCILWGTTWIASKEGVLHMPALQMASIRQVIAGLLYVGFFLYKKVPLPKGKEWIPVLVLSFLNFIVSNGLSTLALQYNITAGLGAIIGAIFPLWIVVIGLFNRGNKMPVMAITGMILGFAGVCIIFYDHLDDFWNKKFQLGILFSFIATWTWALATIYTKKQAANFNPYFSLGLQMLISGACLFSFTHINGTAVSLTAIPWESWASIAYLIIFGSLLAFICYLYALQNLPTEQASIYAYVNPIVAVLCGWVFFGDEISIFITIGGLVTLLGVYLVNKAFRSAVPPAEQPETEGV